MSSEQDRELLELAAKAAGISLQLHGDIAFNVSDEANHVIWNPLTDDGDALRLAVKLYMQIRDDGQIVTAQVGGHPPALVGHINADRYAATRRAIVRAAAAAMAKED